jgi:hypothetical protein
MDSFHIIGSVIVVAGFVFLALGMIDWKLGTKPGKRKSEDVEFTLCDECPDIHDPKCASICGRS